MSSREFISIILLGETAVGKTSLLSQYNSKQFDKNILSTIGYEFKLNKAKIKIDGQEKMIRLKIWDTAGQLRFRQQVIITLKNCLGAILVYDVTNQESFDSINDWIQIIESKKDIDKFPIVLCGNKTDLEESRVISYEEGEKLAEKNNFPFFEISAKENINVNEAFQCLIEKIAEIYKNEFLDNNVLGENFTLESQTLQQNQKKKCCSK